MSSLDTLDGASPHIEQSSSFRFQNTYARLPERFYARVDPTPVAAPRLIKLNTQLALDLNLDPQALASPAGVAMLAGNRVPHGAEPLAMAYAGHQFGYFVPQLGDGRANLIGEMIGRNGVRYDVQLKGGGRTPFSRGGDGRAAVGPVLREYVVSEAMAVLGVPTTRALAAVITGERVLRETALPGAILTRVAASHLRVGTFQYFAARRDADAVRTLAEYAIERHYPEVNSREQRYRLFLDGVITRHARLVAQWLQLGFVHGVMNTDNTSVSGETIDYGPCAFLEAYDPETVFSSIDLQGRYAYGNQPEIALWNLTRLAECLVPLLEAEHGGDQGAALQSAQEALSGFAPQFLAAREAGFRRKIGLASEQEGDTALTEDLLQAMAANRADFTLTFRHLCEAALGAEGDPAVRGLFADPAAYDPWAARWRRRLEAEQRPLPVIAAEMRSVNPIYVPRNHLVEAVLSAAVVDQNYAPFEELLEVLAHPYEERPGLERYAQPAGPEECVLRTFCGT